VSASFDSGQVLAQEPLVLSLLELVCLQPEQVLLLELPVLVQVFQPLLLPLFL